MYWVFNEEQLEAAIDDYVHDHCADNDEQRATANLLIEFATSDEASRHGLVRGCDASES